ncbi:MAG: esterase-like activity of phytase family protein [Candidatus Kapabacteria bacterium]|nr:esterase-like activity of phytase family protein [Candidatus Kapabacteria bacterium]
MNRWFFFGFCLVCLFTVPVFSVAQTAQVMQFIGRHTQRPATFDKGSAEVVAYDPGTKTAVISDLNGNKISFINVTNPASPTLIRDVLLSAYSGVVNSVAVKNGLVAVALEDAILKSNPGKVVFFDMSGIFKSSVAVGSLPDMVVFTPNGQRLIVCNEGEPEVNYTNDAEGSVSIVNVTNSSAPTVQTVDFRSLNGKQDSLRALGVRIYGPAATVAQDLEPEYAAITADGLTAYITLQENNAIAVIDINNAALVRITALGFKDYSKGLARSTNYPWTNRPSIGTTPAGQNILLGGLSGLWFTGYGADTNKLRFLTHPDRGPNGEPASVRGQLRRPFALPNLQAEVIAIELDRITGAYTILSRTKLFRADGVTPITGLPNLQAAGQGIAYTDELPIDLNGNDLANDPFGGDMEGIAVDAAGTWWMVDEYRPAIYNFNSSGTLISRFIPAGTAASVGAAPGTYGTETLPAIYASRRANRGFEAVAIEGDILYAFIQSPIDNPDLSNDNSSKASTWCRILAFNVVTKTVVGEYLYPMFEKAFSCDKIGDATSLGNGKFYVVERDDATGLRARKYVFEINLKGATNILTSPPALAPGRTVESLSFAECTALGIRPVIKKKAIYLPGAGYGGTDKVEGITRINANTIAVINDNDFGVGGSVLPTPPNGSITVNTTNIPVIGVITFDRPNGLDPSDRDNAAGTGAAIKIGNWPVYGMYQPDGIAAINVAGVDYLITSNEGDARDYGTFVEEVRGGTATFILDTLLNNAWPLLKTNQQLGRLNLVNSLGDIDGDGDFDELYTLGGRSFSIWNVDGNLIYDSGSELESRTAGFFPANFNAGHTTNSMDDRSDNKGPEPEGVTTGVINDSTYAFISCERIGHTFMFNVSDVTNPKYIDYINSRNFAVTPNVTNVDNGTVGDLGPEVIAFVPAIESPNNTDLLLAGNEISGTMSVFQVRVPRIVSFPAAVINHCIPDKLTLTVSATGPTLTYQWMRNGVDIAGATSSTYTVDVLNTTFAGSYTCRVNAAGGMSITPRATQVNVFQRTKIILEPKVLTQVASGITVNLAIDATNTAGETYQWFKAGSTIIDDAKYLGATAKSLTIRNVTFADTSGKYYCVVTGGCSTVRSRDARVYIPVITITLQPRDTTVCPGDTVVLRAAGTATGGDAGVGYQWKYVSGGNLTDGGRFSGTSSPTLRINGVRAEDAREVVCVVTGFPSRDNRFTNPVLIGVRKAPSISRQPTAPNGESSDGVCQGNIFQLQVIAEGENIAYQWYRDGKSIPLANSSRYDTRVPGAYKVRISGACGLFTESASVTMLSITKPQLGNGSPDLLRVEEGKGMTLFVKVLSGSFPVSYQWSKDGRRITGATDSTYKLDKTFAADAGRYVCVVTNSCGVEVSNVTEVRVYRENPTSVTEGDENGVSARCEPNPFTSSATLRVVTTIAGAIHVTVSDLSGRTVYTTTDSDLNAGEHTFSLQGATLGASGVYIVRIEHPSATLVRRVVLAP